MLNKKKFRIVWAIAQILVLASLLTIFLKESGWVMFSGIAGCLVWIISQILFIIEKIKGE